MTVRVLLHDPKYPHNVGQAVRAVSCFGGDELWVTGDRVPLEPRGKASKGGYRLPREERMRGDYVPIVKHARPFDELRQCSCRVQGPPYGIHAPWCTWHGALTPVAVELVPNAEDLPYFVHPERALYVFGPEDGSLPPAVLRHCHRFVRLPMLHCANLASAVYVTLYDRHAKRVLTGLESPLALASTGRSS